MARASPLGVTLTLILNPNQPVPSSLVTLQFYVNTFTNAAPSEALYRHLYGSTETDGRPTLYYGALGSGLVTR